jgi:hypothetical protein
VSGGGLWRTYFIPDGSNHVIENRLVGIAFYEFPSAHGTIGIICHGPGSIYDHVIGNIMQRWPE